MGTTLTGTTPQDTYDSLIKVTDNGPLSGTAKYLSDGLGNDSILALSTSAVGINYTSPARALHIVSNSPQVRISDTAAPTTNFWEIQSAFANTNQDFFISNQGGAALTINASRNVGIGTSTPDSLLHVNNLVNTAYDPSNTLASGQTMRLSNLSTTSGISTNLLFVAQGAGGGNGLGSISGVNTGVGSLALTFATRDSGGSVTERVRILSSGGITFNGDTAAANALDDYEEGEWTPAFTSTGATFTYGNQSGTYTKIGRQVFAQFYLRAISASGTTSNSVTITGLPFTALNTALCQSSASVWFTGTRSITPLNVNNSTTIYLWVNNASPDGLIASEVSGGQYMVGTITYFV